MSEPVVEEGPGGRTQGSRGEGGENGPTARRDHGKRDQDEHVRDLPFRLLQGAPLAVVARQTVQ